MVVNLSFLLDSVNRWKYLKQNRLAGFPMSISILFTNTLSTAEVIKHQRISL
jgi:hypothetical protein